MQKASGPTHLLPLTCFETTRHEDYRGRFPAWTWDRDLPNGGASGIQIHATAGRHICAAALHARYSVGPNPTRDSRRRRGRCGELRPAVHRISKARWRNLPPECSRACVLIPSSSCPHSVLLPFVGTGLQRSPSRICIGWADLYYVPAAKRRAFDALAAIYAARGANAELAIPTILDELASSAPGDGGVSTDQDLERVRSPRVFRPRCWGYCCSSTVCPELLFRHPCGHRMQLSDPQMRHTFETLWSTPTPPL
jgi:hypothetical protein